MKYVTMFKLGGQNIHSLCSLLKHKQKSLCHKSDI